MRVSESVAIVTGAGNGLGRAVSLLLAQRGWQVAAFDVDATALQSVSQEGAAVGGLIRSYECDVTRESVVSAVVDSVVRDMGSIRALVNNAGIEGAMWPLGSFPADTFRQVLEVNTVGAFIVLNAVVANMRASGGGAVVNVASTAAAKGYGAGGIAYTVSKHAVLGLTRESALELAKANIRVNAVAPGPAATRLIRRSERAINPTEPLKARARIVSNIPDGRYATPMEVAEAISFLLSEAASHITGTLLPIDGGELAR